MKTKRILFLLFTSVLLLSPFFTEADEIPKSWSSWWSTPTEIVTSVVSLANEWKATETQDTKLDKINNLPQWNISSKYQISNTFIRLAGKNWIISYIQWAIYIWYVAATVLLVWNGFQLVINKKVNDTKENIKYIVIWIILLTCFYAIIAIVNAIINYFFAWE